MDWSFSPHIPEQKMVVAAFSFVGVLHPPRHTSVYNFISAAFGLLEMQRRRDQWAMEVMIFYKHRLLQRTRSWLGCVLLSDYWIHGRRDSKVTDWPKRRKGRVSRAYSQQERQTARSNTSFGLNARVSTAGPRSWKASVGPAKGALYITDEQ